MEVPRHHTANPVQNLIEPERTRTSDPYQITRPHQTTILPPSNRVAMHFSTFFFRVFMAVVSSKLVNHTSILMPLACRGPDSLSTRRTPVIIWEDGRAKGRYQNLSTLRR